MYTDDSLRSAAELSAKYINDRHLPDKAIDVIDEAGAYAKIYRDPETGSIEITAEDVFFTWNNIIFAGFGNTSTRDSLLIDGELPKIFKVDEYTVKFVLKKPFAPFLRSLSAVIAPKHHNSY